MTFYLLKMMPILGNNIRSSGGFSSSRSNNPLRMKVGNKKNENDIEFDQIVKFLNAQKAVMDYASLN